MKLNQFARQPRTVAQEIQELQTIKFIPSNWSKWQPNQALEKLLIKSFPEVIADCVFEKLTNLAATTKQNAAQYCQNDSVSATAFYNLYFQLLGFQPEQDFSLAEPQKIKASLTYPQFEHTILTTADLIHGWYQLLIARTTNGQTFLDELTARGYFQALVEDPQTPRPLIFNGKAQAVFDTRKLIHEVVYVESDQDSDHDGQRDLLKAEIIRPAESNSLPVPALYTASPYNQGTNDRLGSQLTHNVNVPLTVKKTQSQTVAGNPVQLTQAPARPDPQSNQAPQESFGASFNYRLNDYFLARGFAVVYAAGIGTKDSQGLRTCGDPEETRSTTAIIEWLDQKRRAFTSPQVQHTTTASWCNQHIAMTGRSYLGTLAIAAATTGVSGLKTIISEAAISSWYDYYREHGLVVAPGGFPGEDSDVLAVETYSQQQNYGQYLKVKKTWHQQLQSLTHGQERSTGNYTDFWEHRNYRHQLEQVQADIIMVHGLNDWNVKPKQVYKLWQRLQSLPITTKLILHQGPHIYINNFRSLDFPEMMNLWLTYKLYDCDNQAAQILPTVLIQDNVQTETWHQQDSWPQNPQQTKSYTFQHHGLQDDGQVSISEIEQFQDQLPPAKFQFYTHNLKQWEKDLSQVKASPLEKNRLLYQSQPLKQDLILDGRPEVRLRVASNQNLGLISVRLLDYGHYQRLGSLPQTLKTQAYDLGYHYQTEDLKEYQLNPQATEYQLITLGHLNLQNRQELTRVDPVEAGKFYDLSLLLQPTHYHLTPGHKLVLIVYATDFAMTIRGNQNLNYQIDLAHSQLILPYY
ncbi:Xaa-Pro dipeptidyl-peptidase [Lactobacillus sp. DCY120]|uniref:Xaa-Pro dipeptidyl-peptidase n=1 Tax=Bombilactobacillus apium TaxID=2675299 RepID=A0A850R0S0_9LACO|nr:Xaa-Pro dipeptidyl-peptidase [Bombilactobacillus apium]NVY95621.1 Xaa-Pro dipeptidyl-peptidase [Bombilactobacillus apium]